MSVPALLSAAALSLRLGVPPKTLYDWAAAGKIPHYRLSRLVRFSEEEIVAWLDTRHHLPSETRRRPRRTPPGYVQRIVASARRSAYRPTGKPNPPRAPEEVTDGAV